MRLNIKEEGEGLRGSQSTQGLGDHGKEEEFYYK